MEERIKEFDHMLQSGHEKLQEFDNKGHILLNNISNDAKTTFKIILKETRETNKRIEEKSDKAWNFLKFFAVVALGTGLALSGANTLMLQNTISASDLESHKVELEKYYMTKENAEKVYLMQEKRVDLVAEGDTITIIPSNYKFLIESLFHTNSRGSHTNK